MAKDWTIRTAGTDDAERLSLIGTATFLESFAGILDGDAIAGHCQTQHSAAAYHDYLEAGSTAWLAEMNEGGAPVGYALNTAPDLSAAGADDLELKRIYLFSRFHGTGLGAALLDECVQQAQHSGAARLLLGVYAENLRAIGFYKKHGFTEIGDRHFQVGHKTYYDAVLAKLL